MTREKLNREILTDEQVALLPLVHSFARSFGLVGGTAVALQLGHRRSVDFDLFTAKRFSVFSIRKIIAHHAPIEHVFADRDIEFTIVVRGVKITFFHYPFPITYSIPLGTTIKMADLLTLAAMKAYALGRRAKWKDYIDLYFIMKHYGLGDITKKARHIFGSEFNEKLFRAQLAYFKDIDHSEKVIYLKGHEVSDRVIKETLKKISVAE